MVKTIATSRRSFRLGFVSNVISELRKVVWPSRQEALRLTALVLVVCFTIGGILFAIDYGFSRLVADVILP